MGDVNIDLDLSRRRGIFILADAQFLPFKNNCFNMIRATHVIEHLQNPLQFINDAYRVTKDQLLIICPHKYALKAKYNGHLWGFNVRWFEKALQTLGIHSYRIRTTFYAVIPYEIIVEVKK
ncbi:MAG: class I SAM-dependent methyltransferase [Proteobacteria bacterium]|nr:class I SAM-dependent methyltransferase [Pseudomonadota bacterium]